VDQRIGLVPLVCPQCSTPVPAEENEVAWACAQCGQGIYLDLKTGPQRLPIYYAAAIPPQSRGKPYWVADGRVTMVREAYRSDKRSVQEAENFWSQARRFFVPAFAAPLETLLTQAISLLLHPLIIKAGPPARFEPVTLSLEDVPAVAEFIVIAVEAGRKDQLKRINPDVKLSPPALWILP
jgi:hypothetical protein